MKRLLVGIIGFLILSGCTPEEPLSSTVQTDTVLTPIVVSHEYLEPWNDVSSHLQTHLLQDLTMEPVLAPHFSDDRQNLLLNNHQDTCRSNGPTSTVHYKNTEKGISFQFPYNPEWDALHQGQDPASKAIRVGEKDTVIFGPIGSYDGCVVSQYYTLTFLPSKNILTLADILNTQTWHHYNAEVRELNGIRFVAYDSPGGLCARPAVQVQGKSHNYLIEPTCGHDDERWILEDLVRTMELS